MEEINIYLRQLRPEDVTDEYVSWFSDSVVHEFLDSKNITKKDSIEYIKFGIREKQYYLYGIFDDSNDKHIGNVKVGPINWRHGTSDLVTVIGDRNYWGKGLATKAIKLGNDIAFDVYDIRKVSGPVAEKNIGSLKAYRRAGWVAEAILKGHKVINVEPQDQIIISCFNPKYFDNTPKDILLGLEEERK